jgi:16S rRNA (guanine(966)-N(2))-methyltransferase RsmD
MRVVSGQSKGRRLLALRGQTVRPTQAKVKEALFNILASLVAGARVLDLFAGTGGIGIEALSRGAESVDFVERHPPSRKVLEENLKRCGYQSRARIHRLDAFRYLRQAARGVVPFDIVFVDPPYHTGILKKVLPLLSQDVIITHAGIMIIEHFHKTELPDVLGPFHRFRAQRYGDTVLSFYRRKAA